MTFSSRNIQRCFPVAVPFVRISLFSVRQQLLSSRARRRNRSRSRRRDCPWTMSLSPHHSMCSSSARGLYSNALCVHACLSHVHPPSIKVYVCMCVCASTPKRGLQRETRLDLRNHGMRKSRCFFMPRLGCECLFAVPSRAFDNN